MKLDKLINFKTLNETSRTRALPRLRTRFSGPGDFEDFLRQWPRANVYYEHQGGGAWMAWVKKRSTF